MITSEQAEKIIELLESIDSRLSNIESNTDYDSSSHDELVQIRKILKERS